ncbi:hypothetical protein CO051_00915 [Candidatus Roizmanbacteria bacterium CG_4_9_14_0_2_um_filter_39_13]|uniref:Uncharacterized protein n=2 Tax=Candidatus Roizmaniibacteriota TaxID=1752723 RepID=A0A2M8F3I4_9BACT|nr:MAG: hypothetical protein COY15_05250 [Candidatus Roizmanbacteria bacterium CG_4_10_14_0_2_um_filter_39_12]PJC33848.1 MAG: hypothetical protein CO051_00915 [Candidatus Roizmanbacteria bacterium CG_4_9_14_0_2_um_filter_39_13]PJE61727.1 MAG: hypothetical protein COU87_03045 [Candidatus Roizmanbacteria bacterium CG10_big_fil_rev_8_21_14_0_10_39_12]
MTFSIKYFLNLFQQPKQYFFFGLPSREKKKIVLRAVEESNKMQVDLLKKYEKKFPNNTQQYYIN